MADNGYVSLEADPEATAEIALRDAMAEAKGTPPAEPDAPPVAAEPETPPPPPPAPASAEDDDEPAVTDAQTMVPMAALKEARAHLKSLKAQVADVDALRQKAAQLDALAPVVEQWRPTIEALRARPDLLQQARQPAPGDPYEAKVSAQEAEEYARDIQLYTPEGKLDVATAKRALAREHKIATVAAQEAARSVVAPLQAESAGLKAQQARQWALQQAAQEGDPVDQETFDTLWKHLPPELVAQNPTGIGMLVKMVARGMNPRKPAPAVPPAPPPVVPTEPPGGRTPAIAALTDLDRRMAKEIGRKPSEYQSIAAKFNLGSINVLED